jgi:hypothetical protein
MQDQAYMCPCCDSLLGFNEKGYLFILSSMSRRGVTSTHSGDPRFYQYLPDPVPPTAQQQPAPTATARPTPITDESGELLVDDHTAALVHQALVKDLFDRGIISNTTDI